MRRHLVTVLIAVVFLAGLGLLLRHDLALRAWRQGQERLRAGDYGAALTFLSRAGKVSPDAMPIAFDTGVALYRLGEFHKAQERFAAAAAADDPALRSAALYNLGNCAYRRGEKTEAGDREGARRLFREAARQYLGALAVAPAASDASHNLSVVSTRLAELAGGASRGADSGPARSGERRGAEVSAKSASQGEQAPRAGEESAGRPKESGKETALGSLEERSGASAQAGKGGRTLSRDEAERLLDEARGREALTAAAPGPGRAGRLARPDKDW